MVAVDGGGLAGREFRARARRVGEAMPRRSTSAMPRLEIRGDREYVGRLDTYQR